MTPSIMDMRQAQSDSLYPQQPNAPPPPVPFPAVAFALLAAVSIMNLNAVGARIFGVEQAFSVVIFAAAVFLCYRLRYAVAALLRDAVIRYYIVSILLYMCIGLAAGAAEEQATTVRSLVATVLIVLASAAVGYDARQRGIEPVVVRIIFFVSLAATLTIFIDMIYPRWSELMQSVEDTSRSSGFWGNANEAGLQCSVLIAAALAFWKVSERLRYTVVGCVIGVVACAVTFSRSGLLLVAAQLVVVPLFSGAASKPGRRLAVIVLAALLLGVAGFLLFEVAPQWLEDREQLRRVEQMTDVLSNWTLGEDTTNDRSRLWAAGLAEWESSPLVGHGLHTMDPMPHEEMGPHNTIILLLAEAGILPGFLFTVALAMLSFRVFAGHSALLRTLNIGLVLVFWMSVLSTHNFLSARGVQLLCGLVIGNVALRTTVRRAESTIGVEGNMGRQVQYESARMS